MITDADLLAARRAYAGRHNIDLDDPLPTAWMRAALEAVEKKWQTIETFPKYWGEYLVWSKGYGMNIRGFQLLNGGTDGKLAGHWYDDEDVCRDYEITHWMPLPEPPK